VRVEESILASCPHYRNSDVYIPISIATQAVKNCLNLNLNLPLEKVLESWISDSPVY
jgi:hypothetical protein